MSIFYKPAPAPSPPSMKIDTHPESPDTKDIIIDNPTEQLNILIEVVMRLQQENKRLTDRLHELEVENENYKIRYES